MSKPELPEDHPFGPPRVWRESTSAPPLDEPFAVDTLSDADLEMAAKSMGVVPEKMNSVGGAPNEYARELAGANYILERARWINGDRPTEPRKPTTPFEIGEAAGRMASALRESGRRKAAEVSTFLFRDKTDAYDAIKTAALAQPPPTPLQAALQRLSFAYGNLAASTNHKPPLEAFWRLAGPPQTDGSGMGLTWRQFREWASGRVWTESAASAILAAHTEVGPTGRWFHVKKDADGAYVNGEPINPDPRDVRAELPTEPKIEAGPLAGVFLEDWEWARLGKRALDILFNHDESGACIVCSAGGPRPHRAGCQLASLHADVAALRQANKEEPTPQK